jgi:hypothetical protein
MAVPVFSALLPAVRDQNDQSVYTTASITPTANKVLFLAVGQKHTASDQAAPTVSGGGVATWTQVSTVNSTRRRLTVFRAETGAAPTSGAITITLAATLASMAWAVIEVEDSKRSGTNAADAVVQSITDANTAGTAIGLPLSGAWANADSQGLTFIYYSSGGSGPVVPGVGLTSLGGVEGGSADNAGGMEAFYGRNGSSQEIGVTLDGSDISLGIGLEIAGYEDVFVPIVQLTPFRTRGINGNLN